MEILNDFNLWFIWFLLHRCISGELVFIGKGTQVKMFLTHLFVENNANDYGLLLEVHSNGGALHQFRKALYKLAKECYEQADGYDLYRRINNIMKGAEPLTYAGYRFEFVIGDPEQYFDIEWFNTSTGFKNCIDIKLCVSWFRIVQRFFDYEDACWTDEKVIDYE